MAAHPRKFDYEGMTTIQLHYLLDGLETAKAEAKSTEEIERIRDIEDKVERIINQRIEDDRQGNLFSRT